AKERTACVRWIKPATRADDPQEFDKEEIVSVYQLEGHPDYDYRYSDVVVRLSPVTICSEASAGETDVELSDLSWVGNITGLKNGDIEVTW
ncbi:ubiquitin-conjugating enzyme E2, partial [Trifolium medium]|nr:ubiquitin-conjugating enzyme E2 [Trifolium medium]